jgi:thioredoxin 1
MPIILNDNNFDQEINKTDKLALVDFYATWCGPCSALAPILEEIEKKFSEKLVLLKANVDENRVNAEKFKVDLIPSIILFKNGQIIDSFTGFKSESDIEDWLKKHI